MKLSKELIAGIITIAAILVLVTGVNFLKGKSFFGGDDVYYVYFPNSGGVTAATPVLVNGVEVGKVLEVDLTNNADSMKKVMMKFNIQKAGFKIPKNARIEAGSLDLFSKGLIIKMSNTVNGYYPLGAKIQGMVSISITSQVKEYADPITKNVQTMMGSIDRMVNDISAFWDSSATSEIEGSLHEVKIAIKKFGNAATQIEEMVVSERAKLADILSNVQSITENLKKSNEDVKTIIGNVKTISDDMVTSDFKSVIADARKTLQSVNLILESAEKGEGTLGKLVNDQELYDQLVSTNKSLQNLLSDLQLHPERYIHFSILGAKTKGVPLTSEEEKKLREILEKTP